MIRATPILVLLLLASVPLVAGAQARPDEPVRLDFQNTELADVIAMIAELTGKNFIYDQDRVSGRVTVISPTPVTIDEAYRVFESILQVRGLTTVPGAGGTLKIVQISQAKQSAIETLPSDAVVPNRDLYVTRLIPLSYVKADAISNTLRPLISREASLIAYQPTNSLIITDSAANIRRLDTIIGQIDIETYREQVKVVPIEYADASVLAAQLEERFSESPGRAPTRAAPRARRAAQQAARAADVVGLVGEPRFMADERTNSIIVIATRTMIREIEKLIRLLDYERKGSGRIHVFRLQNADAEEMAQTLSTLTTAPAGTAGPRGASATAAAAIAELGSGVRVIADGPTNSLIIQANSEGFATISEIITALDVRRPQVMVEALILEVDITDTQSLGLAWLYQNATSKGFFSIGVDPPGALGEPTGTPPINRGEGLIGSTSADLTAAVLGKQIFIPGIGTVPIFQGVLIASQNDENVNLISAPVILTADNEEAEIIIGQEIPIPTSLLETADPSAAGGFQTSQNIARENVGVTLRVTPQIGEGDTVRLEIFQEISEVTSTDSELGPTTRHRQVETTLYVRDGEAVMLGGIISEVQGEAESKVPFLGDIPIIGWLFKSTIDTVRKVNLLIILTPRIVRNPEDLKQLTLERRERFRDSASAGYSAEELAERQAALAAGVKLPDDPNPARRELERHESRYPVELLPDLRSQKEERERERLEELEAQQSDGEGGPYLVQAAFFYDSNDAIALLQLLIDLGYDGTVFSRPEGDEPVHFVQLGPYVSEETARRVAREVRYEADLEPVVLIEQPER